VFFAQRTPEYSINSGSDSKLHAELAGSFVKSIDDQPEQQLTDGIQYHRPELFVGSKPVNTKSAGSKF
jgi:hypothetical protein